MNDQSNSETLIWQWLDDVVIDLNLCPFAKKPRRQNQIRLVMATSESLTALLDKFADELDHLAKTPDEQTDTTMFAIQNELADFEDYLDFLDECHRVNDELGYEGVFQLASFHPDYQFEGLEFDDHANLTNRSPLPIVHIIREESVSRVLKNYPSPERIPEDNIDRVRALNSQQLTQLFPYLFK